MIEIRNVNLPVTASVTPQDPQLKSLAASRLGVDEARIVSLGLAKRSVDARRKSNVHFVVTLTVTLDNDAEESEADVVRRVSSDHVRIAPTEAPLAVPRIAPQPELRPIVVGTGPAGLFAALILARAGVRPLLFERGAKVDERVQAVERFLSGGVLDRESNIQFGEGGAGTFSDGKLTTNTRDPRCRSVLETLVAAGAPEEILWQARPHVGTDLLTGVVKRLRREIQELGGEVSFGMRLADVVLDQNSALSRVVFHSGAGSQEFPADTLILATGHSARDTFELLHRHGAHLVQKPFSVGVRIEHTQEMVNRAQYGSYAGYPSLGPADYKLSGQVSSGRGVYTFCMCPGGWVVAATSEDEAVVTNGMSRYAREGLNANSAFLVTVLPSDFQDDHPLAGVDFQRRWERVAFRLGGRDFRAPAQLMGDFLQGVPSTECGGIEPTYPLGVSFTDLAECLPEFVVQSLREAAPLFDRRLRGFATADAVLTGVETRSSSPVRVVRDGTLQSNLRGVYPCGEGAGYAGGIMSAAVDGIRCAQAVLMRYI